MLLYDFYFFLGGGTSEERDSLSFLFGFLGEQDSLDVGQYTTLCDGYAGQKLVQFLVVPDSELKMSRDDPSFLVVSGGITCQLENFSSQVFKNSGEVDCSSGSYSLGVISFSQKSVNTTDGKLETGSARAGLTLSLSFATTRHVDRLVGGRKSKFRVFDCEQRSEIVRASVSSGPYLCTPPIEAPHFVSTNHIERYVSPLSQMQRRL